MRTPAASETPPNAAVASPLPGSSRLRRTLDRVQRFLFGHDIFISYARTDAIDYAQGLADALIQRRIAAYVDQLGTPPGPRLPPLLFLRLLRSSMLVLIASPKAAASLPVRREVEEFTRRRDRVFVIDVAGALDGMDWYRDRIKGGPAKLISHEELRSGTPSEAVVNRIVDSIDFATRERRLRRTAKYTAAGILVAIVVALAVLRGLSQEAEAARSEATRWQSQADSARQEAGAALQQKTAAERLAEQAEQQRAQAESLRLRADSLADLALLAEAAARASAEEQRRIARALNLANQATSALDETGEGLVRSVLLAVESLELAWTPEGFGAWVRGMNLLPRHLESWPAHAAPVSAVAFSRDGRRMASWSTDGKITAWDMASGNLAPRSSLEGRPPVPALAVSPDGGWLATGAGREAWVWNIDTRERHVLAARGSVVSTAFSPDGRWLAIANQEPVPQLFTREGESWREVSLSPAASEFARVLAVAFSADGRWLAMGGVDRVAVWDPATRRRLGLAPLGSGHVGAVAFSPDGRRLAAVGSQAAWLWDLGETQDDSAGVSLGLSERARWRTHHISGTVWQASVAFSPDGRYLATAEADSVARIWEVDTQQEVARLLGTAGAVAFVPGGGTVVTGQEDGTLGLWSATERADSIRLVHADRVQSLTFSPDGRLLATGSADGLVRVFETAGWSERIGKRFEGEISTLGFSHDGRWIVAISGKEKKTVRVFESGTGRDRPPLEHEHPVGEYRFSPDGRWLATWIVHRCYEPVGQRRREFTATETRVWNVATGQTLAWRWDGCTGNPAPPTSGGLQRLISESAMWPQSPARGRETHWRAAANGSVVELSEAGTGRKIAEVRHWHSVTGVTLSADQHWLATASADSTVRLWPVSPLGRDLLIAAACARLPRKRLTDDEWRTFVSEGEPRQTCPHRPEEGGDLP